MKYIRMKHIATILLAILFTNLTIAQGLNEELGFVFVKGEYLMETERYDDAISEFNKIIKENPNFKEVLLLRAKAKYILGAHLGVRNDVIEFIEFNGVTPTAARLLGLADYELNKFDSALNSLTTAIGYFQDDVSVFEARAAIYAEKGEYLKACADWKKAAALGSSEAKRMRKKNCGGRDILAEESKPSKKTTSKGKGNDKDGTVSRDEKPRKDSPEESTTASTDDMIMDNSDDKIEDEEEKDEDDTTEDMDEDVVDIDAENEIYVDEDLTLILKDGLGDRQVLEQPNILILSDDSGTVAIDVCITTGGRVESAKYNASKSSLNTKSIISLAVRKAKEFWFEKSKTGQICGLIEFKVSGRE